MTSNLGARLDDPGHDGRGFGSAAPVRRCAAGSAVVGASHRGFGASSADAHNAPSGPSSNALITADTRSSAGPTTNRFIGVLPGSILDAILPKVRRRSQPAASRRSVDPNSKGERSVPVPATPRDHLQSGRRLGTRALLRSPNTNFDEIAVGRVLIEQAVYCVALQNYWAPRRQVQETAAGRVPGGIDLLPCAPGSRRSRTNWAQHPAVTGHRCQEET